jgi:hypothetical protein
MRDRKAAFGSETPRMRENKSAFGSGRDVLREIVRGFRSETLRMRARMQAPAPDAPQGTT